MRLPIAVELGDPLHQTAKDAKHAKMSPRPGSEMDEQSDTDLPIPFFVDALPDSLKPLVESALDDDLHSQEAHQAIEEYWEEDGDRTAPLLLAYAYLRVRDARAVMVDRLMEETDLALQLCEQARRLGVDRPNQVAEFEQTCRELFSEEKERRDYWYKMAGFEPSELHDEELLPVASELHRRGDHDRAVVFYAPALDIEAAPPTDDWLDYGDSLEEAGREAKARELYREIVSRRSEVDETLVLSAYARLVVSAPDETAADLFEEARAWAEDIDATWPWGYASQDALLERSIELDAPEMALHVADVVDAREGAVSREVREHVREARRRYSE